MARMHGFKAVVNMVTVASGNAVDHMIELPLGALSETINVKCTATPSSILGAIFPVLHAQDRPTPIRVGGQIHEPKKTKHVAPVCPIDLPVGETRVVLTGTVRVDGSVEPDPAQSGAQSMDAIFGAVAAAVRQWEFTPVRLNGQPIAVTINVTVNFTK
jgi:hypothetical protein